MEASTLEPDGIRSDEKFLVGVSGIPDYCVNLWDWEDERLLNHLPLNQPHPAADQVTVLLGAYPGGGAGHCVNLWA